MSLPLPRSTARDFEVLNDSNKQIEALYQSDAQPLDVVAQLRVDEEVFYLEDGAIESALHFQKFSPLPKEFLALRASRKSSSRSGLLPELQRAWISIDNALYLWDYKSNDFCLYDSFGPGDMVLSVGLSAPKQDVFSTSVSYILIVTTLMEIAMFSVTLHDVKNHSQRDKFELHRVPCSIKTNGVMHKVVSSANSSNMFTIDSNGNTNKLEFSTAITALQWIPFGALLFGEYDDNSGDDDQLNPKKRRKIEYNFRLLSIGKWSPSQSTGIFQYLPAFLQSDQQHNVLSENERMNMSSMASGTTGEQNEFADAVLDNERSLVYTCCTGGHFDLYDIRGTCPHKHKSFNVIDAAKTWVLKHKKNDVSSSRIGYKNWQVSRLLLLSAKEYEGIHILVILNDGTRIYLQTLCSNGDLYTDFTNLKCIPSSTRVLKVRQLTLANNVDFNLANAACYSHGTYLLSGEIISQTEKRFTCLSLEQDTSNFSADKNKKASRLSRASGEIVSFPLDSADVSKNGSQFQSTPQDICEECSNQNHCSVERNSFSSRNFLCLDTHGVYTLGRTRAIDKIKLQIDELFLKNIGTRSAKVKSDRMNFIDSLIRSQGNNANIVELCARVIQIVLYGDEYTLLTKELPLLIMKNRECCSPRLVWTPAEVIFIPSAIIRCLRLILARSISEFHNEPLVGNDGHLNTSYRVEATRKKVESLRTLEKIMEDLFQHAITQSPLTEAESNIMLNQAKSQDNLNSRTQAEFVIKNELETSNISVLFRHIKRTRQALSLLCELSKPEDGIITDNMHFAEDSDTGLKRASITDVFEWSLLCDYTLDSLITDERACIQLRSMLQACMRNLASIREFQYGFEIVTLAEKLCSIAPSYFHEGDAKEIIAYLEIEALLKGDSENDINDSFVTIRDNLMYASKYWRRLEDVSNQTLNVCGNSTLGLYCGMMAQLGNDSYLELIVDLCFECASHFISNDSLSIANMTDVNDNCYHSGSNLSSKQQNLGRQHCYHHVLSVISSSASAINAKGGSVLITDRQRQCMLSKCLVLTKDDMFMFMMCDSLRGRHTDSLLLQLPCVDFLEKYLCIRDKNLLFDWYLLRARSAIENTSQLEGHAIVTNISYAASQYEHASNTMLVLAESKTPEIEASSSIDVSQEIDDSIHSEWKLPTEELSGHLPISLRYDYLSKASLALENAIHEIQSIIPQPRKLSRDQHGYFVGENQRLCNKYDILLRQKHLANIQIDAYRMSLTANASFGDNSLLLGFTLISAEEWVKKYFAMIREMRFFGINLRLVSILGTDTGNCIDQHVLNFPEAFTIRLWKSFIYQRVPDCTLHDTQEHSVAVASAAAAAVTFLKDKKQESEIDVDMMKRDSSESFENFALWLPTLKDELVALCEHLEVGDSEKSTAIHSKPMDSAAPLAPLIVELEALIATLDKVNEAQHYSLGQCAGAKSLQGWVTNMLLSVRIRRIGVARAYASILKSRAKGFEPERIVKLVQSFTYVLYAWVGKAVKKSRESGTSHDPIEIDLRDLSLTISTKELDQWIDLLRHHISDMQGRRHLSSLCQSTMVGIQRDFQKLIAHIDQLSI